MNATRLKGWIGVVALLLIGAALGVFADRMMAIDRASHRASSRESDPVRLTPEQRQKVVQIFVRRQPTLDSIWSETRAKLSAAVDSTAAEIRPVLRPDQIPVFEQEVLKVKADFNEAASGKRRNRDRR
jgi:hypothetical protein